MTNILATMPAAELRAHKMRAAWPEITLVEPPTEVEAKIECSRAILAAEDKKKAEFTGDEPPFLKMRHVVALSGYLK